MCFSFFDTLSLVTPLSLLISLSFLKPLSIVFQDWIWSVCFNVVVCTRIQRRKKREFKEQKKKKIQKKKKEKEKCQKKKIKKVLIKFWEVKWKEGVLLWRRRVEKKKFVEWKFQKELTFQQILKTLLIFTFTHFYFIPFTFTLHYIPIKSLFDLEDCVVQILIWLRRKKVWYEYFWHPFMRLLVLSWLSVFHVIYMWGVWFCLHYSAHIYCWECYTPFQSDFNCWVINPERF